MITKEIRKTGHSQLSPLLPRKFDNFLTHVYEGDLGAAETPKMDDQVKSALKKAARDLWVKLKVPGAHPGVVKMGGFAFFFFCVSRPSLQFTKS